MGAREYPRRQKESACGIAVYRSDLIEQDLIPGELHNHPQRDYWIELLANRTCIKYTEPKDGNQFDNNGCNILLHCNDLTLPAHSIDFDLWDYEQWNSAGRPIKKSI